MPSSTRIPPASPPTASDPSPVFAEDSHRFQGRLVRRLLLPYSLLIALSFAVAGGIFLHTSLAALDDAMSTRLKGMAELVAGEMKPDYLKRLVPGAESTRLFRTQIRRLLRFKSNTNAVDMFVIDRNGRVLLDADQEVPIGDEYLFLKLDQVELDKVWQGQSVASTLYSGDNDNLYKSGYAPVLDADGTVIAAVGVEAGASFLGAVSDLRRNVVLLVLAAVAMTGIISVVVSRSIVGPIRQLVSAIGQVIGESRYPTVPVTTRDEVGYLTESFNRMTQRLKTKDAELTRLYELERERAERIEDLSDLVFEGIPNGVIAVDPSGRVLLCNPAAARIIPVEGYPFPETGIPASAAAVLEAGNPVLRCLMTSLDQQETFLREDVRFETGSGEERVLGISSFPLSDRDNKQMGAIAIFSDLTELTRLQDQIKIQERLAALGELSAGIAHEIRNPLGAIHGFVELLGRRTDDPAAQKIITNILREVGALNHIVTDFLTFAREPPPILELCDAEMVLTDAVSLAVPEGSEPPIEVSIQVADDVPAIPLDPAQVRRALVNILQNGVIAMGDEGGRLTAQLQVQGDGLAFRIHDSGPGIPEEVGDKVFNPFFTTRPEGTGLGLAIANKVVEGHGGRIHVENPKGGGARFTLWFPLTSSVQEPEEFAPQKELSI